MTHTFATLQVPVTISEERVLNLLTNALEGGSNYWYSFGRIATKHITSGEGDTFDAKLWGRLQAGMHIVIDNKEEPTKKGVISMTRIIAALSLMAEKHTFHFYDFMTENDDATTGDVFFQLVCFGEVVYG